VVSSDDYGGVLRKEFTVECATCNYWEPLSGVSFKHAEKYARRNGWSKTKSFGWICKECEKKDSGSLKFWRPDVWRIAHTEAQDKKCA